MDDPAYKAAQRRVVKHLIMQITFVADVLFVVLITAMTFRYSRGPVPGVLVWLLIGGTLLTIHALFTFDFFKRRIDRAVQRELEREVRKEKPKRQSLKLGEDGELVEIGEEALITSPSSNNHDSKSQKS